MSGLTPSEMRKMPPFPFPERLFPPGTFPPVRDLRRKQQRASYSLDAAWFVRYWRYAQGMRFSNDFNLPPAVDELLESGGPEALQALLGTAKGGNQRRASASARRQAHVFARAMSEDDSASDTASTTSGSDSGSSSWMTDEDVVLDDGAGHVSCNGAAAHAHCSADNDNVPSAKVSPPAVQPPPLADGRRWIDAAKAGHFGTLQSMLPRAPDLWAYRGPGLGHTALHWAAARNDVPTLMWLLSQRDADLDIRNGVGSTACHAAAGNDAAGALKALLAAGADVSACDDNGESPRDVAARLNRLAVLEILDAATRQPAKVVVPTQADPVSLPRAPLQTSLPPAACNAPQLDREQAAFPFHVRDVSHGPDPQSSVPASVPADSAACSPPVTSASAPADAADAADAAAAAQERLEVLPDVGVVQKDVGRAWLEAARRGDTPALQHLLNEHLQLLYFWGAGTNFGFTGHSALHWAAAKGHVDAVRFLLHAGMQPDVPNHGGARALHAAAANGQLAAARVLILEGGAEAALRNGLGETPRELALQSGFSDVAAAIESASRASALRSCLSQDGSLAGANAIRIAQAALAAAGQDLRSLTERAELQAAAQQLVAGLPALARPPEGRVPVPPPKVSCRATRATGPPAAASDTGEANAVAQQSTTAPMSSSHASSYAAGRERAKHDEVAGAAADRIHADAAKARGNAAFAAGQYARAITAYSMALRLDRGNAVLLSNRSAARAAAGDYAGALEDADRAVRGAPKWGKAHARRGAALIGLGQGGEAVKAYLAGLAVEPGAEYLREGLAEAKQAIRNAQARYTSMWGEAHPGTLQDDSSQDDS